MEELKKCPFCGEDKARLVYMNEETRETIPVDTEEELNDSKICAYVHCYGCDIDFCADVMSKPKDVIKAWNNRVLSICKCGRCRSWKNITVRRWGNECV